MKNFIFVLFAFSLALAACKKEVVSTIPHQFHGYLKTDTTIINGDTLISNGDTLMIGNDTTILDSVVYEYKYYVDGTEVTSSEFPAENFTTYRFFSHPSKTILGNPTYITAKALAFSDEQDYYSYGANLGHDLELLDQITAHLHDYAETSGYISEYEETGEVSQEYFDYQANFIDSVLNKSNKNNAVPKGLLTFVHKGCNTGSNWYISAGFHPIMPLTYSNNVSSFSPLFIGGINSVFDKVFFYGRPLHTFAGFHGNRIEFCGSANPYRDL